MATSQIGQVIQHLRSAALREGTDLPDGDLLDSFVTRRDEAALEGIVRRHAPMVWGVCCRVLGDHHDAEDAFQATFLVLVRKANSIKPREMVGNWLYGVAHQTALKARATRAKRRMREAPMSEASESAAPQPHALHDLQPVLDQELSRLPEKYRSVIVLCELEGRTLKEAARQLRVPNGTVASRLATARKMLAKALTRHGHPVSVAALATVLTHNAASACAPTTVVSSTIKVATAVAAGHAAATALVSSKVAALTEGVLKAMYIAKLKSIAVVLAAICMMALAGGVLHHAMAEGQPVQKGAPDPATEKAEGKGKPALDKGLEQLAKDQLKIEQLTRDLKALQIENDLLKNELKRALTSADIDRLQGFWPIISVERDGKPVKEFPWDGLLAKETVLIPVIKNKFDEGQGIRFQIDSTKNPKTIDLRLQTGAVSEGIYKVERNQLTICFQGTKAAVKIRPLTFDSKGDDVTLMVLKKPLNPD